MKATKKMAQAALNSILEAFRQANSFVITSHEHPDGDAIGSMLALYYLLRDMGKTDILLVNEDPPPPHYRWLPEAGRIRTAADAPSSTEPDLAVIVDTGRLNRLGGAAEFARKAARRIVLDHHLEEAPCGDINLVDASRAAAGELIFALFEASNHEVSREAAECLYVAIATDTGGFKFSNTTPETHRIAARLLEAGIDHAGICERVFDGMSAPKFDLLRQTLGQARFAANGRVAHASISQEDLRAAGATPDDMEGIINFLRNVDGVRVAIVFRETGTGATKVSLRSRNGFNSAAFLEQFGGGGHALAAGATMDMPLEAAQLEVLEKIQPLVGEETP